MLSNASCLDVTGKKIVLFCITLYSLFNPVFHFGLTKIQSDFINYEKKINSGKIYSEDQIPDQLKKYSLYPYLELELIKNKLTTEPFAQIKEFYANHQNSPVSKKLNYYVVNYLNNRSRFNELIDYYVPNNNYAIKCLYFSALQKIDPTKIEAKEINDIWLTSSSRPKQCNNLFDTWVNNNTITYDLIWQRINLAIEKQNSDLVLSLARYTPPQDTENLKLWYRVYKNPNLITHTQLFNTDNSFHHKIIIEGLKKEANKNIDKSLRYYRELSQAFAFSDKDVYDYYAYVATRMLLRDHENTENLIQEIPIEYYDEQLHTTAIKSALKINNWLLVIKRINELPIELKKQDIWVYWLARAHEELKDNTTAKKLYSKISNKVNYYGILACKNLKNACPIEFAITSSYRKDKIKLLKNPGINRAVELFKLNRYEQARLEWNDAVKNLNDKQRFIAASLANDLNWHDRSITTMALYEKENATQENGNNTNANMYNAILTDLKYPMGYKNNIIKFAKQYKVDPAWMFAISRQESSFIAHAKSKAGALGLMQLMPDTARQVARHNKIKYRSKDNLLNETTNIHLGAAYLQQMLNRYDGNPIFATAAYNAGPTQVRKWIKVNKAMSTDVWIELIPFYETRDYLKRVLTNTAVYRSKLGNNPILLNNQLQVSLVD